MLAARLIFRLFLTRFVIVLVSCTAIYSAVELVDLANFAQSPTMTQFFWRIPFIIVMVSPIVFLISGCWLGVHLVRTEQYTALMACGLAPVRGLLIVPFLGILWSLGLWGCANEVAPRGLERWQPTLESDRRPVWGHQSPHFYRIEQILSNGEFRNVLFIEVDDDYQVNRQIHASSLTKKQGRWLFIDGIQVLKGRRSRRFSDLPAGDFRPQPYFAVVPQQLTGQELDISLSRALRTGADTGHLHAEKGLRGALALACPVCVAFGLIIGVLFGRRPGIAFCSISGIGLGYWSILSPVWILALSGVLQGIHVALGPFLILAPIAGICWYFALK